MCSKHVDFVRVKNERAKNWVCESGQTFKINGNEANQRCNFLMWIFLASVAFGNDAWANCLFLRLNMLCRNNLTRLSTY